MKIFSKWNKPHKIYPIWLMYFALLVFGVYIQYHNHEVYLIALLLCGLTSISTYNKNIEIFGKDYKKTKTLNSSVLYK